MATIRRLAVGLIVAFGSVSCASPSDGGPGRGVSTAERPASTVGFPCEGQLIVFLEPDRSDGEAAALAAEIADIDGVVGVRVVGHNETFREFEELFVDQPELVETVTPEMLPPSARVRAEGDDTARAVARRYRSDARVKEVIIAADRFDYRPGGDGLCRSTGS